MRTVNKNNVYIEIDKNYIMIMKRIKYFIVY